MDFLLIGADECEFKSCSLTEDEHIGGKGGPAPRYLYLGSKASIHYSEFSLSASQGNREQECPSTTSESIGPYLQLHNAIKSRHCELPTQSKVRYLSVDISRERVSHGGEENRY